MLTSEGDALYQAILEEPLDDGLRLIYADWLEDNGDPRRAEFIRVQMELARYEQYEEATAARRYHYLLRRQEEIFSTVWLPLFTGELRQWWFGRLPDAPDHDRPFGYVMRRGFVAESWCSLADWLAHGPRMLREQPLERADFTDRAPFHLLNDEWVWARWEGDGMPPGPEPALADYSEMLPACLWKLLRPEYHDERILGEVACYRSERDAREDLAKAAALDWARQPDGVRYGGVVTPHPSPS